jgi:hypothetical protein
MKMTVFRDTAPCSLTEADRRFRSAAMSVLTSFPPLIHWSGQVSTWSGLLLLHQPLSCEWLTHRSGDGGSKQLWKVGQLLWNCTAQSPRRLLLSRREIPRLLRNRQFNIRPWHCIPSYARWISSTQSHPVYLRCIPQNCDQVFHDVSSLPASGLKFCMNFHPLISALCHTYLIFDLIILIIFVEVYKLRSCLPLPPVSCYIISPNPTPQKRAPLTL